MISNFRRDGKLFFTIRRRLVAVVAALVLLFLFPVVPVRASEDGAIQLDVHFRNSSEIFSPKAAVTLEITPKSPDGSAATLLQERPLTLTVSLYQSADTEISAVTAFRKRSEPTKKELLFEQEVAVLPDADSPVIPFSFPAPAREGVYELVLSLHRRPDSAAGTLWSLSGIPLQRRQAKLLAETSTQCVVVNPNPLPRPVGYDETAVHKELLETIDLTGQAGWKRRASIPVLPKVAAKMPELPKIPEIPKFSGFRERPSNHPLPSDTTSVEVPTRSIRSLSGRTSRFVETFVEQWSSGAGPQGSGHLKALGPSLQDVTYSALAPAESTDTESWEAFPLTVREIGKAHLLEIDYPDGVPQTLGIAVVEFPHRDGGNAAVLTVDSGIHLAEPIVVDPASGRTLTQRILFWPKTKQSVLLLSNRERNRDAVFGKIRLYRVAGNSATTAVNQDAPRLPQPYAEKRERLVAGSIHRSDILEFLASEDRPLSSTLANDWNVLYEGSSRLIDMLLQGGYDGVMLNVASKDAVLYPTTVFRTPAAEHSNKDGLELLLRLFERDRLVLIPSIDFNGPLEAVEDFLKRHPQLAGEIFCADGDTEQDIRRYNLLHPAVQDAMVDAVRELVLRCGRYRSFGGVGVLLTPESCTRLPDPLRGLDDRTVRQFVQETGTTLPDGIEARVRLLQSNPAVAEAWTQWRIRKVGEFYARLTRTVVEARPDARLYLSGGTMLDHPSLRSFCTPALSRRIPLFQTLRSLGFDPTWIAEVPALTFLRPCRISSDAESESAAAYLDFDSIDLASLSAYDNTASGALFFHDSGFATVPAGMESRRRFVKQLAQADFPVFFDGGFSLPTGQAETLGDLLATYRRLPVLFYETFRSKTETPSGDGGAEASLQPLTVRYTSTPAGLVVYMVNDAPFEIGAELSFSIPPASVPTLVELSGRRPVEALSTQEGNTRWRVSLRPYDLIAVRLNDAEAVLRKVDVERSESACGKNGQLKQKVEQLRERIQSARFGIPWDKLENAGFESQDERSEEPVGWNRFGTESFSVRLDGSMKHAGRSSLKLSKNAAGETGLVLSHSFPAPSTGRLFTSVLVSTPEKAPPTPLCIVLTAKHHGQPFFRSFRVDLASGSRWQRIIAPFDRLPVEEFEELRIGFEMSEPGTVWIDDVTLYQVAFTKDETNELFRLLSAADLRCSTNRTSDLLTILEGYWAQYLFRHVPERTVAKMEMPISKTPAAAPAGSEKPYASQAKPAVPKPESPGIVDRVKSWFSPR